MSQAGSKLLLLAVSTAGCLGVAEAVARLAHLAPEVHRLRTDAAKSAYRATENPILGYELKPNYRDAGSPDLRESFPYTNADGQRDKERRVARVPGVRRLLVLGDSVVAGHGIRELEQTIPGQLERQLGPEGIEVLNFGVGGYCTRAEVELLRVKGLKYRPDAVLVVFVSNDYDDYSGQAGREAREHEVADRLFIRSSFFRALSLRLNLFHYRDELDPAWAERRNKEAIGGNNVESGFRELAELRRQHGFQVTIAIWPTFLEDRIVDSGHPNGPRYRLDERSKVVRLARRNRFPTIQLSAAFESDYSARCAAPGSCAGPSAVYTTGDGLHSSPLGAEVAASALAESARALAGSSR